jgi:hypothetical protein
MIFRRRSACAGHRAALLDFIDRRERGPGTDVALAHLDRCRHCETELSEIALAITALRRIRSEVQLAEPSRDAWERVRRVAVRRPAPPWRWRISLGATMVAAALAAVVVMPTAFGSLAAPWPPIAGGDASATLDGSPAGAASATRIYDPPAGTLTARVVTILAGEAGLDRPREARALTFLPAATDRAEVERARRWAATSTETLTRAATRE